MNVGPWINVGLGKYGKNNESRALKKSRKLENKYGQNSKVW